MVKHEQEESQNPLYTLIFDFSSPVLESSFEMNKSISLMRSQDLVNYNLEDWKTLASDIEDQDLESFDFSIHKVSDTSYKIEMDLQNMNSEISNYSILIFPYLQSQNFYPLDQKNFNSAYAPFRYDFEILEFNKTSEISFEQNTEQANQSNTNEIQDVNENLNSTEFESEDNQETENSNTNSTSDWQRVFITEVVTDPQQDHNESSGGNDIPFDSQAGSGTIGSTDEYIEIYNGSQQSVDLTDWQIHMNDGSDETLSFLDTSADLIFSKNGSIQNFQDGEILVIGNPEGALNNEIYIELINNIGEIEDAIWIDDANAQDTSDEAYTLDNFGNWEQTEASPLEIHIKNAIF